MEGTGLQGPRAAEAQGQHAVQKSEDTSVSYYSGEEWYDDSILDGVIVALVHPTT